MKLEHLLEADGFLLLRYLVDHPSSPPTPVAVSPDG
jgi:hypothetical protein